MKYDEVFGQVIELLLSFHSSDMYAQAAKFYKEMSDFDKSLTK